MTVDTTATPQFGHFPSSSGEALDVVGDLLVLRTTPSPQARMLLVEATTYPGGGPPPHTHSAEELFLVLEGSCAFLTGEPAVERIGRPGDVVHVPGDSPHCYRSVGDSPARMLVLFDDGLQMAGFFRDLGRPVDPANWSPLAPRPVEEIVSICAAHGVELIGPPPA